MTRLLILLGSFGVVAAIGSAVLLHDLPASIVGNGSFFGYLPPGAVGTGYPVSISLNWWPSLLWLPGAGLVLGIGVGLVLARVGWRVTCVERP